MRATEPGRTSFLHCPVDLNTRALGEAVREMYSRVAQDPGGEFHFHRGPEYATRALGYEAAELGRLPERTTRSFAGVGNPHAVAPIRPGETVLDIGCGSGTDLLLAARRAGPSGQAIGVDVTDAMLEASREGAREAGLHNVEVRKGDVHDLPVDDSSVDVVISNGVLNLAPDKSRAFGEVARVLRPGGRLQLADIVARDELDEEVRRDYELWATWIGGALPVGELVAALHGVGLVDGRIVAEFDPFLGTSKERTARRYGVIGVSVAARRP